MKTSMVKVENGDVLAACRSLLRQLLEKKIVDALLTPKALPGGVGFAPALVKSPALLDDVNPFAPTLPVQSARILSDLTRSPAGRRVGATLKPCELRAAVELTKFLQVNLDNVVTIGVDCPGTYEVKDFSEMSEKDRSSACRALLDSLVSGVSADDTAIRECCRVCEYPAPICADMTVGIVGCGGADSLAVIIGERLEKDLTGKLDLAFKDGEPAGRQETISQIRRRRKAAKDKALGQLKERARSLEALATDVLAACIRCHNCMNVCPICYCKECVFQSAIFEHRPDQLLSWAERKGAVRMPADTLMFHLTRMTHMATSCVACGMCDSACPSRLPVSKLFSLAGEELQEMFGYVPGRDAAEKPPVSVFREDELQTQTESH